MDKQCREYALKKMQEKGIFEFMKFYNSQTQLDKGEV
jgi:hypothetical protein